MEIGIVLRNAGSAAHRDNFINCARAAEHAGFETLWLFDHIAIAPDQAEGSDGIYYDALATLSFLAGCTERIGLGTGALILPYRPALLTAKWLATLQSVSNNRLQLGVGVGWMNCEFQALGVNRSRRGKITDDTLAFIHQCFSNDIVEANGQEFLFRPRPPRPPIYIGGKAPHALDRALRYGDGWMPIGKKPEDIAADISSYRDRAAQSTQPRPRILTFGQLPLHDADAATEFCARYEAAGIDHLIHGFRYTTAQEFLEELDALRDFIAKRPSAPRGRNPEGR